MKSYKYKRLAFKNKEIHVFKRCSTQERINKVKLLKTSQFVGLPFTKTDTYSVPLKSLQKEPHFLYGGGGGGVVCLFFILKRLGQVILDT